MWGLTVLSYREAHRARTLPQHSWFAADNFFSKMAAWPSGLRRHVKVVVRKGVSSNLTAVTYPLFRYCFPLEIMQLFTCTFT